MKLSRKMGKRALSLLIAFMMCVSMMPVSAFAAEEPEASAVVEMVSEGAAEDDTGSTEGTPDTADSEEGSSTSDEEENDGESLDASEEGNEETSEENEGSDESETTDGETDADGETAEGDKTTADATAEGDKSAADATAEGDKTADDATAEGDATADDATAEGDKTTDDAIAEGDKTADDTIAEGDKTADDATAEGDKSAADGEASADGETPATTETVTPPAGSTGDSTSTTDEEYIDTDDDDDDDNGNTTDSASVETETVETEKPEVPAPAVTEPQVAETVSEPVPEVISEEPEASDDSDKPQAPAEQSDTKDEADEGVAVGTAEVSVQNALPPEQNVQVVSTPEATSTPQAESGIVALLEDFSEAAKQAWSNFVNFLKNGNSEKKYTLTEDLYQVDTGEGFDAEVKVDGLTVDLNGFKINLNQAITIDCRDTFTLNDSKGNNGQDGQITGSQSGGIVVKSGSTFIMNGGTITGNIKQSSGSGGAGVEVESGGNFEMYGGEISNNKAYHHIETVDGKEVYRYGRMENGSYKFDDNEITRGGGVYVAQQASFTMSGGKIKENYAGEGAGIFSDAPNVKKYSTFTMKGGDIESNIAHAGEGGGIYIRGQATIKADPDKLINIKKNETHTANDLGGGGIYIENWGSLIMDNVVITGNKADGRGGGLAACVHGKTSIVTAEKNGAAIYGNTAQNMAPITANNRVDGSQLWYDQTGDKKDRGDKITGASSDIFTASDSEEGQSGIILSDKMLGGGSAGWTGFGLDHRASDPLVYEVDKSGHNETYKETLGFSTIDGIQNNGVFNDRLLGLHSTATATDIAKAYANGNGGGMVYIEGNTSTMNGGGIANNGILIIGADPNNKEAVHGSKLTIDIPKNLVNANPDKGGTYAPDLQEGEYSFSVTQDNKSPLHAYDQNGNKLENATVSIDANGQAHISFGEEFFASQFENKWQSEEKEVTLVLKENQSEKENVIYDKSEYTISFKIHKTVEDRKLGSNTIKTTDYTVSKTVAQQTADATGKPMEAKILYRQDGFEENKTSDKVTISNPVVDEEGNVILEPALSFTNKYDTSNDLGVEKTAAGAVFEDDNGNRLVYSKDENGKEKWSIIDKAGNPVVNPNGTVVWSKTDGTTGKKTTVSIGTDDTVNWKVNGEAVDFSDNNSIELVDKNSHKISIQKEDGSSVLKVKANDVKFSIFYVDADGKEVQCYRGIDKDGKLTYTIDASQSKGETFVTKDGQLNLELLADVTYVLKEAEAPGYDVSLAKTYVILSEQDREAYDAYVKTQKELSTRLQNLITNKDYTVWNSSEKLQATIRVDNTAEKEIPVYIGIDLEKVSSDKDRSISSTKPGEDGKEEANEAAFQIYYVNKVTDEDGKTIDVNMYLAVGTDDDGNPKYFFTEDSSKASILTNGLKLGISKDDKALLKNIVYYLQETVAPDGFVKDPSIYVIKDGTVENIDKPFNGESSDYTNFKTADGKTLQDLWNALYSDDGAKKAIENFNEAAQNDADDLNTLLGALGDASDPTSLRGQLEALRKEIYGDGTEENRGAKVEIETAIKEFNDKKNELQTMKDTASIDVKGTSMSLSELEGELKRLEDSLKTDKGNFDQYKTGYEEATTEADKVYYRGLLEAMQKDDSSTNANKARFELLKQLRDSFLKTKDGETIKGLEDDVSELPDDLNPDKTDGLLVKYNGYDQKISALMKQTVTLSNGTLKNTDITITDLQSVLDAIDKLQGKFTDYGKNLGEKNQDLQKAVNAYNAGNKALNEIVKSYLSFGSLKKDEDNVSTLFPNTPEEVYSPHWAVIWNNTQIDPLTAETETEPTPVGPLTLGTYTFEYTFNDPTPDVPETPTSPTNPDPTPVPETPETPVTPDGGDTPTPTPTPDPTPTLDDTPDTPDTPTTPDTPETPEVSDEPTPLAELPDAETPLADLPEEDTPLTKLPDEDVPLVEMLDEPVPLAAAPQTGDQSMIWLYLALLLSGGALMLLRKKEEKEG